MKLLVTGGAGYIGSVVTAQLLDAGHQVVVLDDLSTGHRDAVPDGATFVQGRVHEAAEVLDASYDGVVHFAAKSLVAESVERPESYWETNVVGTLALLAAMRSGPRASPGVQLHRRDLRDTLEHPDPRGGPTASDQPLRAQQARRGHGHRRARHRPRPARRPACATSTSAARAAAWVNATTPRPTSSRTC